MGPNRLRYTFNYKKYLYQGDSDSEGSQHPTNMPRHPIFDLWERLGSQGYGRTYDIHNSEMTFDGDIMSHATQCGADDLRYGPLNAGTPLDYVTNDDVKMSRSDLFGDDLEYDVHVHGGAMAHGDVIGYTAYPNAPPGMISMSPSLGSNGMEFMSVGGDSPLQDAAGMHGVTEPAGNNHNGPGPEWRYVSLKHGS